jgi:transcriptional regulator with XRE-family HTH domain
MEHQELKQQFGARVRSLRRRKGLTQTRLADLIGKSLDTVSNIERGVSSTGIETMAYIAVALGVDLAELFDWIEPVSPDKEVRRAVERLVRLVEGESADTIETVTRMVELALGLQDRQQH